MDEQNYVLERLFEDLASCEDGDRQADLKLAIGAVQKHGPAQGTRAASEPLRCALGDGKYPCGTLKLHARPYRDRDDFPKHLLAGG